jgi:transcriptional regulator with XRE-family HTH domain
VAVRANALGGYLSARREQLCPVDIGLVAGKRRRVAGLRREEVATLAGISCAYYLRLEQGRDTHPSGQVVEALARALQLDLKATEYLHRLANATGSPRPPSADDTVAETLRQMIDQLPVPVVVGNRYLDALAANACARALSPGMEPGGNMLRWIFVAPAARDLYVHWDVVTDIVVSEFREVAGTDLGDPRLRAMIDELSAHSPRFRELWTRSDVGYQTGPMHFRHPQLGDLHLHRTRLRVPHTDGQHMLVYHAEPGSQSAQALEALERARRDSDPQPSDVLGPTARVLWVRESIAPQWDTPT